MTPCRDSECGDVGGLGCERGLQSPRDILPDPLGVSETTHPISLHSNKCPWRWFRVGFQQRPEVFVHTTD